MNCGNMSTLLEIFPYFSTLKSHIKLQIEKFTMNSLKEEKREDMREEEKRHNLEGRNYGRNYRQVV